MTTQNIRKINWLKKRIRTKYSLGTLGKYPRLVIFRSNKHIYGQLIDDNNSATILSASTTDKDIQQKIKKVKTKIEQSKIIGFSLADKMMKQKIDKIIYDRNGYKYHGRVKAIAEAIREKGLKF